MSRFKDLTGLKTGRLTVIKQVDRLTGRGTYWLCQCECGEQTIVRASNLKTTKSCGCLQRETHLKNLKRRHDSGRKKDSISD